MPVLKNPSPDPGRPVHAAREPRGEAQRLDAQAGPVQQLADAGAHAAGEDASRPGAPRKGQGVR
jgi:hypothetical protein